jgi:hypothetical protein
MSRGFLYIIGGREKFYNETIKSIRSLRAVSPNANVTVFVDKVESCTSELTNLADTICEKPMDLRSRMYGGKVHNIHKSPYHQTIFLDSDTYIVSSLEILFESLDYYDLAMTQAPGVPYPTRLEDGQDMPWHIPYNCGMICFRKSPPTLKLFSEWRRLFELQEPGRGFMRGYSNECRREQPAFAIAALKSDARIYTLNHCWNSRVRGPLHLNGPVKVVHARVKEQHLDGVLQKINAKTTARVWDNDSFKDTIKD